MKTKRAVLGLFAICEVVAGLCACSGRKSDPEPIPECQEFERVVGFCDHRKVSLPIAAAPIGKSPEERERMKQLCMLNTARLRRACR